MTPEQRLAALRASDWFPRLETLVAAHGIKHAARLLGCNNHTGLSLLMRGRYPAKADGFEARVRAVLERGETLEKIDCPVQRHRVTRDECRALAAQPAPTHNPLSMHAWRACRQCRNNPMEASHAATG